MNYRIIHIVVAIASQLSVLVMLWMLSLGVVRLDGLRIACLAVMAIIGLMSASAAATPTIWDNLITLAPSGQSPNIKRDNSAKDGGGQ